MRRLDGAMKLGDDERRAVIAMCCAVARADGEVSPPELERLLEILGRLGGGLVSYQELERWLEVGPPEIAAKLGEDDMRACIRDVLMIAHADGVVDEREVATIKRYAERHLEH